MKESRFRFNFFDDMHQSQVDYGFLCVYRKLKNKKIIQKIRNVQRHN